MFHFNEFSDYLKYQKRYSAHTVKSYETDLEQFFEFCKSLNISEEISQVTDKIIRRWISQLLENDLNPRSVNRKLSTLKSYYRFLMKSGWATKNPLERITAPKVKKRLPVFVEEKSINELLDVVNFGEGFKALRNRMIIEIFYRTGIRLSELIHLKDTDIDFYNLTIKVLGKRNKERLVLLVKTYQK